MKKLVFGLLIILSHPLWGVEKNQIKHIVVVYFENRSFDNLLRGFEGANTSDTPFASFEKQKNSSNSPYELLPVVPSMPLPSTLQNEPFLIDTIYAHNQTMPDLIHRFYQNINQINNGKNDRFVEISDAKALAMGYHDMRQSHLWRYAKEYKLCDHFFAAAFGGSFLNHQWLIAGRTPFVGTSSPLKRYVLASNGDVIEDGVLTPDGYVVNTVQPFYPPFHHKATDETKRLPPQTHQTIGDALTHKNISWAWYSGGWDEAKMGNGKAVHYQYHHNPFLYFQNFAPFAQGREHLKDQKDFFNDINMGTLPPVAFLKPSSHTNQHPGYASLKDADNELDTIVKAIQANKALWSKTVIIVTYDENGGLWDHVAPPKGDQFGPSTRIPALIISPFTRNKGVDHTLYDTTSILRFIEWRYDLPHTGEKRAFPKLKL